MPRKPYFGGKRENHAGRKPQTFLDMYCQGFLAAKLQSQDELWINIIHRYHKFPAPLVVISGIAILYNVRSMRGIAKVLKMRMLDFVEEVYKWEDMDWQRIQTYMKKMGYTAKRYYTKGQLPAPDPLPEAPTGLIDFEGAEGLFDETEAEIRDYDPYFLPQNLLDWSYRKAKK